MKQRVALAGKCKAPRQRGVHDFSVWRAAAVVAVGLAAIPLSADMPFYKEGSGTTARAAASVATSSAPAPLDSRTVQSATSEAIAFDSSGVPGMMIMIR